MRSPHIFPALLLVLGLLGITGQAGASQFTPELRTQVEALMATGQTEQALSHLLKLEPELSGDPEYDYLLGVTALTAGQNSLALHAFERVVLVEPRHAGAWIDLAIANMRLGDIDTAASLVQHVEDNFNPPESLRAELRTVKSQLKLAPIINGWRGEAILQWGRVQNANSGLSQSIFQITPLGGTPFPVEIDNSQKPQADSALQGRIGIARSIGHEDGASSDIMGAVRARHYGNLSDNDFIDVGAGWVYSRPLKQFNIKGLQVQAGPTLRYLQMNGQSIGYFTSILAGVSRDWQNCRTGIRAEWERREYTHTGYFSSTIPWLGVSADCGWQNYGFQLSLRHGEDSPDQARPGGETTRNEASAALRVQMSESLAIDALVYLADYRDAEGYSVLLSNNAKRYIHRIGERIGINWQLPGPSRTNWSVQADLDRTKDISNLPISSVDDLQVFVGLRYSIQ